MTVQLVGHQEPSRKANGQKKPTKSSKNDRVRPIFRWAGGKQQLLQHLVHYLPEDLNERTYREPFLGAAALFFFARPARAVLSDLNLDLISTYKNIANDPSLVARYLREHAKRDSSDHYYKMRENFNCATMYSTAQAARFIYLNRTCFNGIYRVNTQGEFNVPYGRKEKPIFPDLNHLRAAADALTCAKLIACDFDTALRDAGDGDFVYLDPPYPALNGTSYFAHYTIDRFDTENQERLSRTVSRLDAVGCKIMMSNADTQLIKDLYESFHMSTLNVPRYVTSKKIKHQVSELVITNYEQKK